MTHCSPKSRGKERGYVLLVLLLFIALLSIAFAMVIQGLDFQIRRDREEELIHRGVQYSRAVRKFIKAFGRYPGSVEELESTNNIRFLRKRYKDPVTGKDFKVLHLSDLPSFMPVAAGTSGVSVASQQGDSSRVINGVDQDAALADTGKSSEPQSSQSDDPAATGPANQTATNGADIASHSQNPRLSRSTTGANPKFGAGPMVGVVSVSKTMTIREFNHKNHYNEWQFVYDPSTDRGSLLTTPNQPAVQGAIQQNGLDNQVSGLTLGGTAVRKNTKDGVLLESPTSQQ